MRYLCIGLLLLMAQSALAKEECTHEMRGDAFFAAMAFRDEVSPKDEQAFNERSLLVAKAFEHLVHGDCDSYVLFKARLRALVAQKSPN